LKFEVDVRKGRPGHAHKSCEIWVLLTHTVHV